MTAATLVAAGDYSGLSTECVQDWHTDCRYVRCGCDCHCRPGLTERQRSVLTAIETYLNRNGYAPSLREIGDATGLRSVSAVAYQVRRLAELGYVNHAPDRSRALGLRRDLFDQASRTSTDRRLLVEELA